jgi:hypothetical protein
VNVQTEKLFRLGLAIQTFAVETEKKEISDEVLLHTCQSLLSKARATLSDHMKTYYGQQA